MISNGKGPAKCDPTTLRGEAEHQARTRFRTTRRRMFRRQLDCAIALAVDEEIVRRWEAGEVRVPAWALEALVLLGGRKVGT